MARMRCSSPKRKFRRARIVQAEGVERIGVSCLVIHPTARVGFLRAQSEQLHDVCQGSRLVRLLTSMERRDLIGLEAGSQS